MHSDNAIIKKGGILMRMMQYELTLTEAGYVVAGGDVRAYDDWDDCLLPPIKMEVLDRTIGDIVDYVCQDHFKGQEDDVAWVDFKEHYVEALKGMCSTWKLIRFKTYAQGLILEYFSHEFDQTTFIALDNIDNMRYELKFFVPRSNGKSDAIYHIKAFSDLRRCTFVNEYIGDVRRRIEFNASLGEMNVTKQNILVTEYADF